MQSYPRLMFRATMSLNTGLKIVTRCHSVFCVYSPATDIKQLAGYRPTFTDTLLLSGWHV